MELDTNIIKLGELNELAYEDLIFPSILVPLLAKWPLDYRGM